jgi:hypothetical protein
MTEKAEKSTYEPDEWRDGKGEPLACDEKLAALQENLAELQDVAREAFEDAVLMGVDERQFRETLRRLVDSIETPYKKG